MNQCKNDLETHNIYFDSYRSSEKRYIRIQFRPQLTAWDRRCGCDFLNDSPLSSSFFCWWKKIYFEFCFAKSPLPCLFASVMKIVATPSQHPLPPDRSYFTQGNWLWKLFWKTMGEVDLDFKWAISLRKTISPSKLLSRNWFSKVHQASSMLTLSPE